MLELYKMVLAGEIGVPEGNLPNQHLARLASVNKPVCTALSLNFQYIALDVITVANEWSCASSIVAEV